MENPYLKMSKDMLDYFKDNHMKELSKIEQAYLKLMYPTENDIIKNYIDILDNVSSYTIEEYSCWRDDFIKWHGYTYNKDYMKDQKYLDLCARFEKFIPYNPNRW